VFFIKQQKQAPKVIQDSFNALIIAGGLLFVPFLFAQTIEQSEALDLGTVAVLDNSEVGTISINRTAFIRTTGGVRLLRAGRPGVFSARGFDSNRRLYITVQANQSGTVTTEVSSQQFTVQSYDHEEFIVTDDDGNADFSVGAVFATSGSGPTNFRDTVYAATYTVTVNY
jgi:hypothetical protein